MKQKLRHYEESIIVSAPPEEIFAYIDDHKRFSSHMNKTSWMMGGGKMDVSVDEGRGQKIGSHIQMSGKAFGIKLFLDEAVMRYEPPRIKTWETVGTPKLLVIGFYKMSIKIKPIDSHSQLLISIDYDLPTTGVWLGKLFSGLYARWCVRQMIKGVRYHFSQVEG